MSVSLPARMDKLFFSWIQQWEWMNHSYTQSHDWISQSATLGWRGQTQKDTYDLVTFPFTKSSETCKSNLWLEARLIYSELGSSGPQFSYWPAGLSNEYRWGLWGSVILTCQMPLAGEYWLKRDKVSPGASNAFSLDPSAGHIGELAQCTICTLSCAFF